jgi:predicted transcriptional regulator
MLKSHNWKKKERFLASKKDRPSTPSIISENTALYPSHVSLTLSELVEKKLVVCLTPKLRKGRLYELTKDGHSVLKNLK